MIRPIAPSQVKDKKTPIPDFVIESFNQLIQKNWDGEEAVITQTEIVKVLTDKLVKNNFGMAATPQALEDFCRNKIFQEKYLDIEKLYQHSGWKVTYENISMEPYYSFQCK